MKQKYWRPVLFSLFFLSGCSALIYQVVWQRMLFTLFGVDLESVTVVVSVFMFGLGIGGLCGGWLADAFPLHLLGLYTVIELGIALFGFLSPGIIARLSNITSASGFTTGACSFLVLAFPTILMGATFPILVTYVNRLDRNVGKSVGGLYFANTMGGALGAYFSGFLLFFFTGLTGAVDRAALLNLAIAVTTFLAFRKTV